MGDDFKRGGAGGAATAWGYGCAISVALVAMVVLAGWILGIREWASFGAGHVPMAPSTAFFFVVYAAAVLIRDHEAAGGRRVRLGVVAVSVCALAALGLAALSLAGFRLDVEHLGITIDDRAGGMLVGHMSPLAGVGFLLASLSYLLGLPSGSRRPWRAVAAWWLAGILASGSAVLLLAYLYGSPILYGIRVIPPAAPTSLAFILLAVTLIRAAAPGAWPAARQYATSRRATHAVTLALATLAAGIVATGWLYARHSERLYRAQVEQQLTAIAELKVDQLEAWRRERLGDGGIFAGNPLFTGLVERRLRQPDDADAEERLRGWLTLFVDTHAYDRVALLDRHGVPLLSVPDGDDTPTGHLAGDVSEVLRSRCVSIVDFHRHTLRGPVHLVVLAPIMGGPDGREPLGALAFRIDPRASLYALITRWPTASQTGETMLVRREGDEVVYLNRLRFGRSPVLGQRTPMERTDATAVKAVLGQSGIVQGLDYRGLPSLSCVRAVPGAPWYVIARMDLAEANAPLRERLWILVAVVSSLLLAAGTVVGFLWRHQSALFYRARYEAAQALHQQEERYRRTLDSMIEGCQIVSRDWIYVYANDAAARHGRRRRDELIGRRMSDCYPGIEQTPLFALLRRCMEQRTAEHLENRFVFADSADAWFELSIEPVPEGLFILSVDISARKQAEEREQHLAQVLRAMRNVNQLITHEKDPGVLVSRACEILTETRGYRSAWIAMLAADGSLAGTASSGLGEGFDALRGQIERGEWPACARPVIAGGDVSVSDATADNCSPCALAGRYSDVSALSGVLAYGGRTYGLLVVAVPKAGAQDPEERSLFRELAGDIGFALHGMAVERERQSAEASIREGESRYRTLFDSSQDAIMTLFPPDWRFSRANASTLRVFGVPDERTLASLQPWALSPERQPDGPRSEDKAREMIDKALAEGANYFEWTHRRLGGEPFPATVLLTRIELDGRVGLQATVRDISLEKQADLERRRLFAAMEQAAEAIVITDVAARIQYVNPAFTRVTGYAREAVLGQNPRVLKSGQHDEPFYRELWDTITAGRPWRGRFVNRRRDGELFTEEAEISPVRDASGAIVNYVAVKRDITHELELEAQLLQAQKLESIGTLAGGVAHEINNPIMGIMNYAQLILDDPGSAGPIAEYAAEIGKETERVATIVRNLLAFARRETQSHSPARMCDIVEGTLSLIRAVMRHDQIALDVDVPSDLPRIRCRTQQIEQTLMNLLTNARDALGERYPRHHPDKRIRIASRLIERDGRPFVRTSIEDLGPGIPAELTKRIFDPFFTTKPRGKGTGLGLSISHGIAVDHGGALSVESVVGDYTRFHLDLPGAVDTRTAGDGSGRRGAGPGQ